MYKSSKFVTCFLVWLAYVIDSFSEHAVFEFSHERSLVIAGEAFPVKWRWFYSAVFCSGLIITGTPCVAVCTCVPHRTDFDGSLASGNLTGQLSICFSPLGTCREYFCDQFLVSVKEPAGQTSEPWRCGRKGAHDCSLSSLHIQIFFLLRAWASPFFWEKKHFIRMFWLCTYDLLISVFVSPFSWLI